MTGLVRDLQLILAAVGDEQAAGEVCVACIVFVDLIAVDRDLGDLGYVGRLGGLACRPDQLARGAVIAQGGLGHAAVDQVHAQDLGGPGVVRVDGAGPVDAVGGDGEGPLAAADGLEAGAVEVVDLVGVVLLLRVSVCRGELDDRGRVAAQGGVPVDGRVGAAQIEVRGIPRDKDGVRVFHRRLQEPVHLQGNGGLVAGVVPGRDGVAPVVRDGVPEVIAPDPAVVGGHRVVGGRRVGVLHGVDRQAVDGAVVQGVELQRDRLPRLHRAGVREAPAPDEVGAHAVIGGDGDLVPGVGFHQPVELGLVAENGDLHRPAQVVGVLAQGDVGGRLAAVGVRILRRLAGADLNRDRALEVQVDALGHGVEGERGVFAAHREVVAQRGLRVFALAPARYGLEFPGRAGILEGERPIVVENVDALGVAGHLKGDGEGGAGLRVRHVEGAAAFCHGGQGQHAVGRAVFAAALLEVLDADVQAVAAVVDLLHGEDRRGAPGADGGDGQLGGGAQRDHHGVGSGDFREGLHRLAGQVVGPVVLAVPGRDHAGVVFQNAVRVAEELNADVRVPGLPGAEGGAGYRDGAADPPSLTNGDVRAILSLERQDARARVAGGDALGGKDLGDPLGFVHRQGVVRQREHDGIAVLVLIGELGVDVDSVGGALVDGRELHVHDGVFAVVRERIGPDGQVLHAQVRLVLHGEEGEALGGAGVALAGVFRQGEDERILILERCRQRVAVAVQLDLLAGDHVLLNIPGRQMLAAGGERRLDGVVFAAPEGGGPHVGSRQIDVQLRAGAEVHLAEGDGAVAQLLGALAEADGVGAQGGVHGAVGVGGHQGVFRAAAVLIGLDGQRLERTLGDHQKLAIVALDGLELREAEALAVAQIAGRGSLHRVKGVLAVHGLERVLLGLDPRVAVEVRQLGGGAAPVAADGGLIGVHVAHGQDHAVAPGIDPGVVVGQVQGVAGRAVHVAHIDRVETALRVGVDVHLELAGGVLLHLRAVLVDVHGRGEEGVDHTCAAGDDGAQGVLGDDIACAVHLKDQQGLILHRLEGELLPAGEDFSVQLGVQEPQVGQVGPAAFLARHQSAAAVHAVGAALVLVEVPQLPDEAGLAPVGGPVLLHGHRAEIEPVDRDHIAVLIGGLLRGVGHAVAVVQPGELHVGQGLALLEGRLVDLPSALALHSQVQGGLGAQHIQGRSPGGGEIVLDLIGEGLRVLVVGIGAVGRVARVLGRGAAEEDGAVVPLRAGEEDIAAGPSAHGLRRGEAFLALAPAGRLDHGVLRGGLGPGLEPGVVAVQAGVVGVPRGVGSQLLRIRVVGRLRLAVGRLGRIQGSVAAVAALVPGLDAVVEVLGPAGLVGGSGGGVVVVRRRLLHLRRGGDGVIVVGGHGSAADGIDVARRLLRFGDFCGRGVAHPRGVDGAGPVGPDVEVQVAGGLVLHIHRDVHRAEGAGGIHQAVGFGPVAVGQLGQDQHGAVFGGGGGPGDGVGQIGLVSHPQDLVLAARRDGGAQIRGVLGAAVVGELEGDVFVVGVEGLGQELTPGVVQRRIELLVVRRVLRQADGNALVGIIGALRLVHIVEEVPAVLPLAVLVVDLVGDQVQLIGEHQEHGPYAEADGHIEAVHGRVVVHMRIIVGMDIGVERALKGAEGELRADGEVDVRLQLHQLDAHADAHLDGQLRRHIDAVPVDQIINVHHRRQIADFGYVHQIHGVVIHREQADLDGLCQPHTILLPDGHQGVVGAVGGDEARNKAGVLVGHLPAVPVFDQHLHI